MDGAPSMQNLARDAQGYVEPGFFVGPAFSCSEAGFFEHGFCLAWGVLVAVLRVDGFALGEFDLEVERGNLHGLRDAAGKMHFDARLGLIPDGAVLKALKIKLGVEFAVKALKQVQVEVGCHSGSIVIGGE